MAQWTTFIEDTDALVPEMVNVIFHKTAKYHPRQTIKFESID